MPLVTALIDDKDQNVEQSIQRLCGSTTVAAIAAGRALQIRALARFDREFNLASWPPNGLGPAEHAEELLRSARQIEAAKATSVSPGMRTGKLAFSMLTPALKSWRHQATPVVLELARLGYNKNNELTPWLAANATDEQMPAVLDAVTTFPDPSRSSTPSHG